MSQLEDFTAIDAIRDFAAANEYRIGAYSFDDRRAIADELSDELFGYIPLDTKVFCTTSLGFAIQQATPELMRTDPKSVADGLHSQAVADAQLFGKLKGINFRWAEDLGNPLDIGRIVTGFVIAHKREEQGREVPVVYFCPVTDSDVYDIDISPLDSLGKNGEGLDTMITSEYVDFEGILASFKRLNGDEQQIATMLQVLNDRPIFDNVAAVSALYAGTMPRSTYPTYGTTVTRHLNPDTTFSTQCHEGELALNLRIPMDEITTFYILIKDIVGQFRQPS